MRIGIRPLGLLVSGLIAGSGVLECWSGDSLSSGRIGRAGFGMTRFCCCRIEDGASAAPRCCGLTDPSRASGWVCSPQGGLWVASGGVCTRQDGFVWFNVGLLDTGWVAIGSGGLILNERRPPGMRSGGLQVRWPAVCFNFANPGQRASLDLTLPSKGRS